MKKKFSPLQFNSEKKMDDHLEQTNLGEEFTQRGKLHKPKKKKENSICLSG